MKKETKYFVLFYENYSMTLYFGNSYTKTYREIYTHPKMVELERQGILNILEKYNLGEKPDEQKNIILTYSTYSKKELENLINIIPEIEQEFDKLYKKLSDVYNNSDFIKENDFKNLTEKL